MTLLRRFAALMEAEYGARLFLFGSRARGTARGSGRGQGDSDYDVVAVSPAFDSAPVYGRAPLWGRLWDAAGGWGIALDLLTMGEAEFRRSLASPFNLLHAAEAAGELVPVAPVRARDATQHRLEAARAGAVGPFARRRRRRSSSRAAMSGRGA